MFLISQKVISCTGQHRTHHRTTTRPSPDHHRTITGQHRTNTGPTPDHHQTIQLRNFLNFAIFNFAIFIGHHPKTSPPSISPPALPRPTIQRCCFACHCVRHCVFSSHPRLRIGVSTAAASTTAAASASSPHRRGPCQGLDHRRNQTSSPKD